MRILALKTRHIAFEHSDPKRKLGYFLVGQVNGRPNMPEMLKDDVVAKVAHSAIVSQKRIENK
jgi:hypothetical protein